MINYKIINVKQLINHPHMHTFTLQFGPFLVNGFTYVGEHEGKSDAIMVPTYGVKKRRLVRAHGIHMKRLRERVRLEINTH